MNGDGGEAAGSPAGAPEVTETQSSDRGMPWCLGGGAAVKAREKEGRRENGEDGVAGSDEGFGWAGVSDSYVSRVRTLVNLPHFCLRFAG